MAYQKGNSSSACKHIFSTNGTITFKTALDTFMIVLHANGHTYIACCTMKVILGIPCTTNATFIAMKYGLIWPIIPKLAFIAVIPSHLCITFATHLGR